MAWKDGERDGRWRGTIKAGAPLALPLKFGCLRDQDRVNDGVRRTCTTPTTFEGGEERSCTGEWRGTWGREGGRREASLQLWRSTAKQRDCLNGWRLARRLEAWEVQNGSRKGDHTRAVAGMGRGVCAWCNGVRGALCVGVVWLWFEWEDLTFCVPLFCAKTQKLKITKFWVESSLLLIRPNNALIVRGVRSKRARF